MSSKPILQKTGPGLFSGVFDFVSREFESFVANATGAGPSTFRVAEDEEGDYEPDTTGDIFVDGWDCDLPSPTRAEKKSGWRSDDNRPSPRSPTHRPVTTSHRYVELLEAGVDDDDSDGSPSPLPLPRALKRRPSITMPGSLFPRSPSMDPTNEFVSRNQRVRFSSVISPDSIDHVSSSRGSRSHKVMEITPTKPRRSPEILRRPSLSPAVKSAVEKFNEDADPSILLPSPMKYSYGLTRSPSVTPHNSDEGFRRFSTAEKGKGRARELLYEDLDYSELPKESRDAHITHIIGKEPSNHDLSSSSIGTVNDEDREKDERIQRLEEEVRRLKEELTKKSSFYMDGNFSLPPPPPPPPPPPTFPHPKKTLISLSETSDPYNLFSSARASLKHAPTPVEKPIVPLKRPGQPTIGLPPDKMAAFLNEMKTVRLRKVTARPDRQERPRTPLHPSGLSAQATVTAPLIHTERLLSSFPNKPVVVESASASVGRNTREKRKRTDSLQEDNRNRQKRNQIPSPSNVNAFPDNVSNTSTTSNTMKATVNLESRQTSLVTDPPTPSLSSDDEFEREDVSLDDCAPSTPPIGPSRAIFRFRGKGIPVNEKGQGSPIQNISIPRGLPLRKNASDFIKTGPRGLRPNVFDKRLPSSPFPSSSPRRPRPPARSSRSVLPLLTSKHQIDEREEDPLSLSFSLHNSQLDQSETREDTSDFDYDASTISYRRAKGSRRLTLDEEIKNAISTAASENLQSEIYAGIGTRSKERGFLAHGGGGGIPVFLGVGYVDGAEDSSHD